MRAEITMLRVPFKRGIIFREKNVPFLFKIMTLEMISDSLGQEFGEIFSKKNADTDVYEAIIWNGYLAACKETYKKPKYNEIQAHYWANYMSAETRQILVEEVKKLMGFLVGDKAGSEELKKK
jgi:hypothetical protein